MADLRDRQRSAGSLKENTSPKKKKKRRKKDVLERKGRSVKTQPRGIGWSE